jgi:hypothetical protein
VSLALLWRQLTGSRRIHRSNSLEETSSQSIRDLILALPIEHYDVKSHEDYKQEKHKLLRYNFKLTDDQVINIRKYTYRGTPFEKSKAISRKSDKITKSSGKIS